MKIGIIVLFFLLISWLASTQSTFCSVMCGSCSGITKNDCSTCRNSNWVLNSGSCIPNSANGFYMGASTPDVGEGITMSVSPWGLLAQNCPPFSTYGTYENDIVTVTVTGGITNPFFQLAAYFGVIALDAANGGGAWDGNSFFTLTMTSGGFTQSNSYRFYTGSVENHYCSDNSKKEEYRRITQSYNYNISSTTIVFSIS